MGKNLHRSILPFIENRLLKHSMVIAIQKFEEDDYYYYIVKRQHNLPDVIVALCDVYHISNLTMYNIPPILNNGGFYLIAKPEATEYFYVIEENKIVIGKLNNLLGALYKYNICTYFPPQK